uniref:Uncharacterized protein n=1 Tax=Solanum lycopersicum TaxID=4081 RepID=A0A3Q7FWH4_SOLLC
MNKPDPINVTLAFAKQTGQYKKSLLNELVPSTINFRADHVPMWSCYDGLDDAVEGSAVVTVSHSYSTDHNQVVHFGAS